MRVRRGTFESVYYTAPLPTPSQRDRAIAIALGVVAFLYRLLAHRNLANDQYMHMAWAQQLLKGELPGRDFVDPGFPLMYVLSAAAQRISPGPFSEAVLSSALLAIAIPAICIVATKMTRSSGWGLLAALFALGLEPRFYSYPKVLVPAITLALLCSLVPGFTRGRIAMLGVWTAIGALFRYDLGVYAAIGAVTAIVVGAPDHHVRWRSLLQYAGWGALTIAPWLIAMQLFEGLPQHFHQTLTFTEGELHQLDFEWPRLVIGGGEPLVTPGNALAIFVYGSYLIPAAVFLLVWLRRRVLTRGDVTMALSSAMILVAYLVLILRSP